MNSIDYASNNRRIAKNTLFLYIRMVVMMGISLFTFRELLKQLGVDDYGTYNVVGGVVILFSFLSNAMTQSSQRFLSFYLGKGDRVEYTKAFSMILNVQVIIALSIIVLAETIGLWFVNYKMNFSPENMTIINWAYQFSIVTFVIQMMQIPFTSTIIAHEKMSFFSYFSIGEAVLKLGVVLALALFSSGRLMIYACLLSLSALIILGVYAIFCFKSLNLCCYQKVVDKELFVNLTSFSGWNMLGGFGVVGTGQGVNILFNIFCGVAVNAAMGISHQVNAAVNSLVSNMQMAFNPQIIKSYAAEDTQYFNSLIFRASRISFFLILVAGLPILICAHPLLELWLTEVPSFAVSFVQLSILYCMVDSLSGSLWVAVQATGAIKWYTLILTLLLLLNIPIGYVLLEFDFSPNCVLLTRVVICFVIHIVRIWYLQRVATFSAWKYFNSVTVKAIICFSICFAFSYILNTWLNFRLSFIIELIASCIISGVTGMFLLLKENERGFIFKKIKGVTDKILR